MQMLGITAMDLLQPENLTALFANAAGIDNNPQELVLNSDFTGLYADVMDIASKNQALLEAVSNMEVLETPQELETFTEPGNPDQGNTALSGEDMANIQISDLAGETEGAVSKQYQTKSEIIGTSEIADTSETIAVTVSENIGTSEITATAVSENVGISDNTQP